MPLPDDIRDDLIAAILEALPPSTFSVDRGGTTLSVDGYLRTAAAGSQSGMGEVGQNAIFYVANGSLLPADIIGGEYVAYDRAPAHGFPEAWKLIRIPPFSDMQTYAITFHVEDGWTTDPDTGNRVPTRTTTTVEAVLAPVNDPRLTETLGVQIGEVALHGYCVNPKTLPASVITGTSGTLTINGVSGTFTLGPSLPDPMPAKQAAFGQYIVGRWKWQV